MKKRINFGNVVILTILCATIGYLLLERKEAPKDIILSLLAETSIVYKHEPEGQDHWQTVAETESLGTGDCEDMALMLACKLEKAGYSPRICVGFQNLQSKELHMWLEIIMNGKEYILDPTENIIFERRNICLYVELPEISFQQKIKEWRIKNEYLY